MTKGIKVLIIFLLILVGLLAAGAGFFYAKTLSLTKNKTADQSQGTDKKITTAVTKDNTANTAAETKTETSTVTQPAPLGDRPSSPTDTYTIQPGETLFSIGKKVDLTWTQIADANGITDANKVKSGQVLIIPKNNQVSFTINQAKAQEIQKTVDTGKNTFRLSALDTAKSDSSPVYGLTTTDTFKEAKVDASSNNATITGTHGDKTYDIKLIQPATKGNKGIWAIESIRPVSG